MLQQTGASLTSTFTGRFAVKAIKPTLKLAKATIGGAMTFALDHFDPMRGNFITLSIPTTSNQTEVTLVVTSPSGLISYNVPLVIFTTDATVLETYNAEDEWVGYTVAGDGIAFGTTIIAYTPRRPEILAATALRSGPTGGGGFTLELIQKSQIKINTAALGIPWVENEAYTFEFSADFTVGTEPDKDFSSPAVSMSYTANPPLTIVSSDPALGAVATDTNDYITFTLNRNAIPYIGQNFYFYKTQGGTDTLLRTFPVASVLSNKTITLDVRGLMQDSTTYYVKSDEEILRDNDNFVFNQLTSESGFRFTSAGQPAFPDFAALVMSAGTLSAAVNVRRSGTANLSALTFEITDAMKVKVVQANILVQSSLAVITGGTFLNRAAMTSVVSITATNNRIRSAASTLPPAAATMTCVFRRLRTPIFGIALTSSASMSTSLLTLIPNPVAGATRGVLGIGQTYYAITGSSLSGGGGTTNINIYNRSTNAFVRAIPLVQNTVSPFETPTISWVGDSPGYIKMSNTYVATHAPAFTSLTGYVKLYNMATGALVRTLTNPTGANAQVEQFGYDMQLTDTYAVVNNWQYNQGGYDNVGRVDVFSIATGNLLRTHSYPATPTEDNIRWGGGSQISGDRLLIRSDATGVNRQPHHVYSLSTGNLLYTIPVATIGIYGGWAKMSNSYIFMRSGSNTYQVLDASDGSFIKTLTLTPRGGSVYGSSDVYISYVSDNFIYAHDTVYRVSNGLPAVVLENPIYDPQTWGDAEFTGAHLYENNVLLGFGELADNSVVYNVYRITI
jgi:hypothetical protein